MLTPQRPSPLGDDATPDLQPRGVLALASYVACSWTWCIGMFLPVLLVRDFGLWGYAAFFIPNVLGAASVAWSVRAGGHAQAMIASHRPAIAAFSIWTMLFQVFFAVWLLRSTDAGVIDGPWGPALIAGAAVAVFACKRPTVVAVAVWGVSAVAFGLCLVSGDGVAVFPSDDPGPRDLVGLAGLAASCMLGFLLCPVMDATLLRARAAAGDHGKAVFALGFLVLFPVMILFTLHLSGRMDLAAPMIAFGPASTLLQAAILTHLVAQLAFTVVAHRLAVPRHAGGIITAALVVSALALLVVGLRVPTWLGLSGGEVVYRAFLSAYGLLFPAYVWLCMTPTWGSPRPPTRRQVAVWVGACITAGPFLAYAFFWREMSWAIPGVGLVIAARLLIPRAGGASPTQSLGPAPAPTGL